MRSIFFRIVQYILQNKAEYVQVMFLKYVSRQEFHINCQIYKVVTIVTFIGEFQHFTSGGHHVYSH